MVNTNGFLQSVNATNADNTPNILQNIASAVVTAMGGFPAPPIGAKGEPLPPQTNNPIPLYPEMVQVVFDPSSFNSIVEANSNLTKYFFSYTDANFLIASNLLPIKITSELANSPSHDLSLPTLPENQRTNSWDGVLYRPALPYFVGINNRLSFAGTNIQRLLALVPNNAPIFSLPVEDSLFVTEVSSFTFNNGFLGSVTYSKPSELGGFFALPGAILAGVAGGITNYVQLRLNIDNSQNSIVAAQTALLNSMASNNAATIGALQSIKTLNNYKSNQNTTNSP